MQIRKKYDFSSVGELKEDLDKSRSQSAQDRVQLPIGIKVPLSLGEGSDGLLKMHYDIEPAIADNFRNMVMTNHGERLGLYDFGANLTGLAFELGTDEFDSEAIRRIRRTTEKYMPYVQLLTFEPLVDRNDNKEVAKVGVRITYRVNALSQKDRVIEAIVFVAG
jgi:phage baseplate assembly protein W